MPRLAVPGFIGPANTQISPSLDVERSYNLYIQPSAPGTGRTPGALVGRPALVPWAYFPDTPIRGMYEQNSRLWAVGGTTYAEVFSDATVGAPHTVATDNLPASMVTNGDAGDQNLIISGRKGYVNTLSTDAFAQITDPDFPAIVHQCEFFDGYGLVWEGGGSIQFQWSGLFDFATWNALDVAQRSTASDYIAGFLRLQRTLLLFGNKTMEPWYDTGDPTTIFAPTGSVLIEQGLVGTFTLARCDNTALWLGGNTEGRVIVYRLDGMTPRRISTFAVETSLAQIDFPYLDTVAVTFQIQGHTYYMLVNPRQADASWIYDLALDRWYQWGHWNTTTCVWEPFRGWCYAFAFQKHLFGDRLTGTIYEMRTDVYTDELTDV